MSKIKNTTPTPVDSYIQVRTKTENAEDIKQVKDTFSRFANYEYGSHLGQKTVIEGVGDDSTMKADTNN